MSTHAIAILAFVASAHAQTTGFLQTTAGPFAYEETSNWVGGNINGIWDSSLTLGVNQVITFGANTDLTSGLRFNYMGNVSGTFRSSAGSEVTLAIGNVEINRTNSNSITIGSTTANQGLAVDLGGVTRTFSVNGGGRGGNFGNTLRFLNSVSNGSVIASGLGSGGGLIDFSARSNSLGSLTLRGVEVGFNSSAYSSGNALSTISGELLADTGINHFTVRSHSSRYAEVHAESFSRNSGATVLFRGNSLGVNAASSATANSSNLLFDSGVTLFGNGAAGTTSVGILAGAIGDTSHTGTGFGATGGLVTYDSTNGVRLLAANEYSGAIQDGQVLPENVRYANSSGIQVITNLTQDTSVNSLSFVVGGATGNQGVTINGDAGVRLTIASGVIYADQNVVTAGSPVATDAMIINAPILDFNGQEGVIFANTRMNTGGTRVSNAPLIINSAITNTNGLTFSNGYGNSGYVVLSGSTANAYSGDTVINGAIVQLNKSIADSAIGGDLVINLGSVYNTGNQIADTADVYINGGTLFLNPSNNSGSATNETINNLIMTGGGVSAGSGTGNTFTLKGDMTLSGGSISSPAAGKLNVAGISTLNGGTASIGRSTSNTVYNSVTTLGSVNISNLESGAYTAIAIASGLPNSYGGRLELLGDVFFT